VTGTGDAGLRQRVRGLLEVAEPPAAPVDAIIRRGRGIRLRRAGIVIGSLGLAGLVAAATMLRPPAPAPQEPPFRVTVPASGIAGPGGVFASGTADGHAWRLAVQNIADPGYRCIPAITINGTDADPVSPDPGNYAAVAPGPAAPGLGFAFIQLPADVDQIVLDGQESLPATMATVCGQRYRLVGFAYRLTHPPRITPVSPASGRPGAYKLPRISTGPPATAYTPATDGVWTNVGSKSAVITGGVLASGHNQDWLIQLAFGSDGNCYEFTAPSAPNPDMTVCAPVSTPDGPEAITALPLAYPLGAHNGPTGYAVQVSPATAQLKATLSGGSTQLATPRVVDGRRYAAFAIGASLRLERLTWLNAAGQVIASTTALPGSGYTGYTQFQP
jgi:hypothetical protein